MRRKRTLSETSERFLIVSTTGLGDTLWATPALRALRQHFPHSYIAILTSEIGKQLLEHSPDLNEIFVIGDPALFSLCKLYRQLIRRRIDTALIFHSSQRPIVPFCTLIGARSIISTKGLTKGFDHLLTTALPCIPQHEIHRRLSIVAATGAIPNQLFKSLGYKEAGVDMELYLTDFDKKAATGLIPTSLPIIGLHPGAKDKYKQWHPEGFIALGRLLQEKLSCQIVITGNSEEKALAERIAAGIPHAISLAGKLSLRTSAVLISRMQLLITNDTGPMHIAFALKTPSVVLFGPTDPKLCGPLDASTTTVIAKPRTCTPCLGKKCRDPFCMLQISIDEVYSAALKLLSYDTKLNREK